MDVDFCLDAVAEAIARYGTPAIVNADQGSQFTSAAFTGLLLDHDIAISMDGRGSWRDNVFVERLWRSVKYEEICLRVYDGVREARASTGSYLDFHDRKRPPSSLDAADTGFHLLRPSDAGFGRMKFNTRKPAKDPLTEADTCADELSHLSRLRSSR